MDDIIAATQVAAAEFFFGFRRGITYAWEALQTASVKRHLLNSAIGMVVSAVCVSTNDCCFFVKMSAVHDCRTNLRLARWTVYRNVCMANILFTRSMRSPSLSRTRFFLSRFRFLTVVIIFFIDKDART